MARGVWGVSLHFFPAPYARYETSISKVFRVKTTCQTGYDGFLAVGTFLTTTTSVNGSGMGV